MSINPHIGEDKDAFYRKNKRLIWSVIKRYFKMAQQRGIDTEDLFQCGSIGFLKAYDRYDPSKFEGVSKFSTYAVPMIQGEVQRMLRDDNPGIKYSRGIKELYVRIIKADLLDETPKAIARKLDAEIHNVQEALSYGRNHVPGRLDAPMQLKDDAEERTLYDMVPVDEDFTQAEIYDFISRLPHNHRKAVELRLDDKRQGEIGETLGVSQVQISRILKAAGQMYEEYLEGKNPEAPKRGRKEKKGATKQIERRQEEMVKTELDGISEAIELLSHSDKTYREIHEETGVTYSKIAELGRKYRSEAKRQSNRGPRPGFAGPRGDREMAKQLLLQGGLGYNEITEQTGVPQGSLTKLKRDALTEAKEEQIATPQVVITPEPAPVTPKHDVEPIAHVVEPERKSIKRLSLKKTIDLELEGNDIPLDDFYTEIEKLKNMIESLGTSHVSFTLGVNAKGE